MPRTFNLLGTNKTHGNVVSVDVKVEKLGTRIQEGVRKNAGAPAGSRRWLSPSSLGGEQIMGLLEVNVDLYLS